jgi:hypothetical protein
MAISSNGVAGLKTGVCTSSTRPSGPYEGQMIYETDTDMIAVWNGTAWRYISATTPTNGTVLQVVTGTTSTQATFTSATPATTGITATITPKSATSKILISASISGVNKQSSNTSLDTWIYRNGSQLLKIGSKILSDNTTNECHGHASALYLDNPATTSATTYAIFGNSNAGSNYALTQWAGASTSVITLSEVAG